MVSSLRVVVIKDLPLVLLLTAHSCVSHLILVKIERIIETTMIQYFDTTETFILFYIILKPGRHNLPNTSTEILKSLCKRSQQSKREKLRYLIRIVHDYEGKISILLTPYLL